MEFLLMVAMLAQLGAQPEAPKVRRDLKPGTIVATGRDAVCLALADAIALEKEGLDPGLTRYVFIPPNIEPASGFKQVAQAVNSTFTRTSTRPQPRLLLDEKKGTAVVAIDLEKYAGRVEQIGEIVDLWERLAPRDSWFNTEVVLIGDSVIEVIDTFTNGQAVEIKLADGKWGPATFKGLSGSKASVLYQGKVIDVPTANVRGISRPAPPVKRTFAAEPYLEDDGVALFALTRSAVPIMRLDEFITFTLDSVNGGLYYELLGVEKNLGNFVAKFAGADAAAKVLRATESMRQAESIHRKAGGEKSIFEIAGQFDRELAKSKSLMNESMVTRRQRAFLFIAGANIAPAEGVQLVAVTFDIAEDNTNPDADPQRNLTTFEKYNGGEAILSLPNGMLAYFVFDANDKAIANVPDNVTFNNKATTYRTNAGTARVSTVTCAACHDADAKNWGWQPVRNDIAADLESIVRILGDRKHGGKFNDKLREVQLLAANYGAGDAELDSMLNRSRVDYQRAVTLATGAKTSREVTLGTADSYWGYWYDSVWPEDAVRDLGHVMTRKEAQAFLLNKIEPNPDHSIPDLFKEDRIIDRLKRGLSVTPAQYRAIAPQIAERLLFAKPPVLEAEGMKP